VGLRFAMPMVFVAWAGNSLYLSLVPHTLQPRCTRRIRSWERVPSSRSRRLRQRRAFASHQLLGAQRRGRSLLRRLRPRAARHGTYANSWWLIGVATILVGAGGGVASGASFAIAARVGRGQRARIFARLLVAAYLGYSLPALLTGVIASHSSFAVGFASVIIGLAFIAIALPILQASGRQGEHTGE